MTFAVRTITRSAAGEDIAHRPQIFESADVVIGRGADCDIRLADLAVSLRHARMTKVGADKVSVESIGAEPFEVGARFVSKAELKPADTPTLIFGSHMLALSAGDDGAVLVDVTRRDTGPETASASNEERIFSLGSSRFGKRPAAWGLALAAVVLFLIWPAFTFFSGQNRHIHADQPWSTGPLSKSHAFLAKNCQACHVKAFVSVRDEACLSCHQSTRSTEAAKQIAANEKSWGGPEKVTLVHDHAAHDLMRDAAPLPPDIGGKVQGLFRRAFNHPNDRCASCHLEHLADAPIKTANAAEPARPLPRPTPVLKMVNNCSGCHDGLRARLGTTTLRDAPDWTHHPEFRPLIARTPIGAMSPVMDRISLVEKPTDHTGLIFSHQTHLAPNGGVTRMAVGLHFPGGDGLACADCHRPSKDGKGFAPIDMTRDCAACHSLAYATGAGGAPRLLPHGHPEKVLAALQDGGGATGGAQSRQAPGFLSRLAAYFGPHRSVDAATKMKALFAPKGLCSECHTAVAPADPQSLDYRIAPIHLTNRYLPWGDFNHDIPEHKRDAAGKPTCETCHQATQSANANEVMLPRISACAACHGRTKARTSTAASAECAECHSFHSPGMATRKADPNAATKAPTATAVVDRPKKLASTTVGQIRF